METGILRSLPTGRPYLIRGRDDTKVSVPKVHKEQEVISSGIREIFELVTRYEANKG